jgi:hypothetical protein
MIASSCKTVRMNISWMRWTGFVAHMGQTKRCINNLVGNPKRRVHLRDLNINGRIIFKLILHTLGVKV